MLVDEEPPALQPSRWLRTVASYSPPLLRHALAAHALQAGYDIRTAWELRRRANVRSTLHRFSCRRCLEISP